MWIAAAIILVLILIAVVAIKSRGESMCNVCGRQKICNNPPSPMWSVFCPPKPDNAPPKPVVPVSADVPVPPNTSDVVNAKPTNDLPKPALIPVTVVQTQPTLPTPQTPQTPVEHFTDIPSYIAGIPEKISELFKSSFLL